MLTITVKEETKDCLHFIIEPSVYNWAVFVGILSMFIVFPLYYFDCTLLTLTSWMCGFMIAYMYLTPWKEIILYKENHQLFLKKQYLHELFLSFGYISRPEFYDLDSILTVRYESGKVIFTLLDHQKVSFPVGDSVGIYGLVEKIHSFLQLDLKQAQVVTPVSESGSLPSEATNEDSSSATSDDSFERIDTADLVDFESQRLEPEKDNNIPLDGTPETLSPNLEPPEELASEKENGSEQANQGLESTAELGLPLDTACKPSGDPETLGPRE